MITAGAPAGAPADGRFAAASHREGADLETDLDNDTYGAHDPSWRRERCGEDAGGPPVPGGFCDDTLGRTRHHPSSSRA